MASPQSPRPILTIACRKSRNQRLAFLVIYGSSASNAYSAGTRWSEAAMSASDGAKADLVISDPPYNVVIDGHATGLGKIHHREFGMASGEMSSAEVTDFLRKAMLAARDHSITGSLAYYFMDWRHMNEILSAGQGVYTELLNLCVWAKSNGGMGSFYRRAHELVFLFKSGTGSHRNNIQLGKFGRYRTNFWNYQGANTFSRSDFEGTLLSLHPTPNPVALIVDAIKDCTARGDLVLDPFLGSGSAVIADERSD